MTKSQIKTLDKLLREFVFERDGHKCRRCGKWERLAPSHIYPKGRYHRLRWEPNNVLTFCFACHMIFWHRNPIEAHQWLTDNFSKEFLDQLKLRANYSDSSPMDYQLLRLSLLIK